jgi:transposase
MKRPEHFTLSTEEGEAILARLSIYAPSRSDCEILMQVMRWYFWLVYALQASKITLKRLRGLLFGKSLKPSPGSQDASGSGQAGDDETRADGVLEADAVGTVVTAGEAPPQPSPSPESDKPKGGHRPGTGRLGADAYVGAERVECRHDELAAGQRCPVCGQGTLYDLPSGVEIRIDGHALLSAIRYELQKLRCSACGAIFTAPLPSEASQTKYSPRARAVLVVSRYYLGLPFYRLEGYQAMQGVPVADATQWEQIEAVARCCYGVFGYLETLAAQGELIHQDDTSVRILTLMQENEQIRARAAAQGLSRATERTGMFTTALVVQVGDRLIALYYSGRAHAGENLAALLEKREAALEPPLAMSDALSRNEVEDGLVVRCHCLAHGRRQFSDIEELFPTECRVVIETLKAVFDHDEVAREQAMSPAARLAYHQAYSEPLMDDLKVWLDQQIDDRLVEPNSVLGKAITYMRTYWETLTRFLHLEQAPLDNNLVERALKLFIRQRKNSLFYKSEHSAHIASVLTSLILTCIYAGVNALEYFVALQEHRAEVFAEPEAWLPWTYRASLGLEVSPSIPP